MSWHAGPAVLAAAIPQLALAGAVAAVEASRASVPCTYWPSLELSPSPVLAS